MVLPGGGVAPLVGGLPLVAGGGGLPLVQGQMVADAAGGKPMAFTTARLPNPQVRFLFLKK